MRSRTRWLNSEDLLSVVSVVIVLDRISVERAFTSSLGGMWVVGGGLRYRDGLALGCVLFSLGLKAIVARHFPWSFGCAVNYCVANRIAAQNCSLGR